ncbi:uncharacterized protein AC631_00660 [Debaryomyces fabryi]|uniref:Redoxin domain-containing protein n=1 Tax=Debaryomyces fabryi TaxID=58627 RepID=A0A0V1Q4T9_9ASCO|nr:uncharacterized protein AC631_00660 [Debaryomyces fabryi]KSA03521.1 hypothetical protein AC631_00660 [Debaryomyces fabryi]CUM54173.1 unnamed protein product [Debaryomyces fabryi]
MSELFPTDVKLKYVPYTKGNDAVASCGNPIEFDLAKELPGKKIVLTAAPGAFTPTCTEEHIPNYLKNVEQFKSKGVDRVIVITANDPFVNAAWGKALGYKDESNYVIFASDPNAALSKELGDNFVADLTKAGLGVRTARYTSIIKDGKVSFLESEDGLGFSEISNASTVLERL